MKSFTLSHLSGSGIVIGKGLLLFILTHLIFGWLWLALYVLRLGVIALAKCFVSGIGRPLTRRDAIISEDYNQRHRMSLVTMLVLEGDMSAAALLPLFRRSVLEATTGEEEPRPLKFIQLQQYLRTFLGFTFWQDDPNFNLNNHIKQISYDDPSTPAHFKSYEGMFEEFSGRPYRAHTSPWELWLVRKFPEEGGGGLRRTVLLWRSHHILMDGHSIFSVLINTLGRKSLVRQIPQANTLRSSSSIPQKLGLLGGVGSLANFMAGFAELQLQSLRNVLLKRSVLKERERQGITVLSDKVNFCRSPKLSLRRVKELATRLGVRVPSLLLTIISESLASALPPSVEAVNSIYIMPLDNHPGTCCNHAYLGTLELPTSSAAAPGSLLAKCKSINATFLSLRMSPLNYVIDYMCFLVGHLPTRMTRFLFPRMVYVPITISNFAVGNLEFNIGGLECVELTGCLGTPRMTTDCAMLIVGFKSHLEVVLASNDNFFSAQDLQLIAGGIEQVFQKLLVEERNKWE